MSTYLLAFANGNFERRYTSQLSGKARPLRIYDVPCSLPVKHRGTQ
jgi:hypothetical protein